MEEKKTTKISLSTFFLIIAIIAICVMGFFIYKLNDDKTKATEQVSELNNQITSLENSVSSLQGKIDTISNTSVSNSNTIETNKSNTNNGNNASFSEEQVKKAISEYLELQANANCGTPLDTLKKNGKINYDSSKSNINTNNGEITTNVKFADYKKAMLNYVTESEFEKNWTSKIGLKENNNGYLTHGQGGGGLRVYTINSVSKIDEKTYLAKTTSIVEDDNSTKSNESITFTVTSSNGNCVIDSIK